MEIDGVCSLCSAVPIYNIDKRPFALLCAYSTGERTTPFVSSSHTPCPVPVWWGQSRNHGLMIADCVCVLRSRCGRISLRDTSCRTSVPSVSASGGAVTQPARIAHHIATGVIILSAVLKRRMILADKSKSLFISKYDAFFARTCPAIADILLLSASRTSFGRLCTE